MNVLIRTDASVEIGSGHVMRCLTIAQMLREQDHTVTFFMKPLLGNLIEYVCEQGFSVVTQVSEADLCIIDHYGIGEEWEKEIRTLVKKILVIDDLANRKHDCDIILDQNVVPNYQSLYDELVPAHCVKLLGPAYLIMREEFIHERKQLRTRSGEVHRILVFMGGSDPTNETMKVLNALEEHVFNHVDVVIGSGNLKKVEIEDFCLRRGYHFHCQINYMASLMVKADFAIGTGGSATWERCYVGLPASSTIVAENQIISTQTAAEYDAVFNLGWHADVTEETYGQLIASLSSRKDELMNMNSKGLKLTETPEGPNPWLDKIMEMMK